MPMYNEIAVGDQAAGDRLDYDWEWSNGESTPGGKPSAPLW